MAQKIKQAFAGGVLGAMVAVFGAQKLVPGVEGSENKTLLAVGAGFLLGAVIGALMKFPVKKAATPS